MSKTMLESVTGDSIYAEIMMDETSAKAFLLVEGVDENSIFFGHVSPDVVMLVCGGKRNVLSAAQVAESEGHSHVYGLVDGDFDCLRKVQYPARVVATQGYDLISDLVNSTPSVLRRTLSAHAAPAVGVVETEAGVPIDEAVFGLTSVLAGLRLASLKDAYPLVFRGYNFTPVIGPGYKPEGLSTYLSNAACKDPNFDLESSIFLEACEKAVALIGGSRRLSGGHDIVGASNAILRKAGAQTSTKGLAATLISVASCATLCSLPAIVLLMTIARTGSGVDLLTCVAV